MTSLARSGAVPLRALLLGGAPGIGKTSVARNLLSHAADGEQLTQWIDVDDLWRHQPWRVDDATRGLVRSNLEAMARNAADAGVRRLVVTWVFQNVDMHELVRTCLPPGASTTTVQLLASEQVWRSRFTEDPLRPAITPFFEARYQGAQTTPADHVIDTDGMDANAVAGEVSRAVWGT